MAAAIHTASLKITNEILAFIAELDEFKGAWRALGRIAPDRLSNLRHVASIESVIEQNGRTRFSTLGTVLPHLAAAAEEPPGKEARP